MKKTLIIGAGVCGPVAAMALQRAGVAAVVYEARESAARSEQAGSYLSVASNGLDALVAVGAESSVIDASFPTRSAVMFSGNGKQLGVVPIGSMAQDRFVTRTIKRADLHRALYEEAVRRGVHFEFGKRLARADITPRGVVAHFEDGSHEEADLLVGCDGVHSSTRRIIDPAAAAPHYVGLLNFGGYTPGVAIAPAGAWHMIFGKRAFFGYVTDPAGGTVWFANVPRHLCTPDERESTTTEQWKRWLIDHFSDDEGPAVDLIVDGVLELAGDSTHDLRSVAMWHRGPMIIIGDAAHAPAPTSGQGASMAIEDAVLLAMCIRDLPQLADAFAAFERLRRRRVERIVAYGARGSSNKAVGTVGRLIRDLLLPFVFRYGVTERNTAWIYEHHVEWQPSRICQQEEQALACTTK